MTSVYFITGKTSSFSILAIASIAGFFLGPLFLMVLGSYLIRSRALWQRVGFGLLFFSVFHVSEGFYQWMQGEPNAFLNAWPNAPFYAELVFIPAYSVITIALSTIYLYLLPQKQNIVGKILCKREYFWTRVLVPVFLLLSIWSHIYGLSSLSIYYTIPLLVLTSLLTIGALPDLKLKLEEQLGHHGSQIFTVIIIGYSASLTIITTMQFGGISLTNVDYYSFFVQSNLQMVGFLPEEKIRILYGLKVIVDVSVIITCLYLVYVAFNKDKSVIYSSVKICRHCFSFVLPVVVILSFGQFFIVTELLHIESRINYSDESQNQTGQISWTVGTSDSEPVITVCGENEHNSTYSKTETDIFGIEVLSDNYTIQRMALTENPNKPYINSFGVDLQCSFLTLIPETEWTTVNTIFSENASISIVYIDVDSNSNLWVVHNPNADDAENAAYALLLWMVVVPIYLFRIWKRNSKPPNQIALFD